MPNKRRTKQDRTRICVQIPPDLRDLLEAAALADNRKLSSYVVNVLVAATKGGRS